MQGPRCRPYSVFLRQRHGSHPQILRNALTPLSFTPPIFKSQLCFLDFDRNCDDGRSLTHQHALLSKRHADGINSSYGDSRTPAERTPWISIFVIAKLSGNRSRNDETGQCSRPEPSDTWRGTNLQRQVFARHLLVDHHTRTLDRERRHPRLDLSSDLCLYSPPLCQTCSFIKS